MGMDMTRTPMPRSKWVGFTLLAGTVVYFTIAVFL